MILDTAKNCHILSKTNPSCFWEKKKAGLNSRCKQLNAEPFLSLAQTQCIGVVDVDSEQIPKVHNNKL